ncbi:MAG: tryptophan--tRNA ligase [Candidatus Margulisbacteria bacterium]|nr:tryptophan--tRNA ligase [Candidatus Margulisiibacteriota bacterium]
MKKQRLVSGIQPTGKMHLGNYLGAVSNWVQLQHTYDAYFLIVDLHALTTVYDNPAKLREDKLNLAIDLLAAGIDPEACCLYYQSDVPEHSELHLILSMLTPLPWLERVPSYKSKLQDLQEKDLNTYGFLGYPVLQAADIMLFNAQHVPVGEDQLPHLELAREIARRFNHLYKTDFFCEPQAQLTHFPVLPGLDGRKMSKSYGNTIPISASEEAVTKSVMSMLTDPNRKRRYDPGNPDICPVFAYHKIYNTKDRISVINQTCKTAELGCVDCKKELAATLNATLAEFRINRTRIANDIGEVQNILKKGAQKARNEAAKTLQNVRILIGL